jgi:receptor expression-enhancing protein 5/6
MESVLNIVNPIIKEISKDFENCKPVRSVAQTLGVEPGHLVGGTFIVSIVLITFGFAASLITSLLGFLYPAYMSFKALEKKDPKEDQQWLTYWVVFIFANFFDNVIGIFFNIIPLYHLLKLIFYVYLYYPRTHGASYIYEHYLRPILKKYEPEIDTYVKKGEERLKADDKKGN